MDPTQSCAGSIIVSDEVLADIGAVESCGVPNIPHDQATGSAWLTVERDDAFYFETTVFSSTLIIDDDWFILPLNWVDET